MRPVDGAERWDDLVLGLPEPHLLQCAAWGELKARWGWRVHRLVWDDGSGDGPASAAAQVLTRSVGG
jgi:hypothetical protein